MLQVGTMAPSSDNEQYTNVRADIAELRGIVTGNLQSLQNAVDRHDREHRDHKVEFDQIHARQNELAKESASNTARINGIEAKTSRAPSWTAVVVSALSLAVAIGGSIVWAA